MGYDENTPQATAQPSTDKKKKCRKRRTKKNKVADSLIPPISTPKFGRGDRHVAQDLYIAIRCSWSEGAIQRVLLANWVGDSVLDMKLNGANFLQVREKVIKKIEGKVLIGHGLDHILYCMQMQHPWANLRDGATHLPFMKEVADPLTVMILPRSIDDLAFEVLNRQVPSSPTADSLKEEAKACMDLYRAVRYDWEIATTKLLQQKERQRGVKLMAPHQGESLLSSISEDSDQYYSTSGNGPAGFHEYAIKPDEHPEVAEDHSTQAPTEIPHEDSSVSPREDDMSINTKTSNQSAWVQQDTLPQDGTKKQSGFWGSMWSPKQSQQPKESTHPIDADDWLCEESEGPLRRNIVQEEDEIGAHLPSGLFGESSSLFEGESDHDRPEREQSSHYVEGTDWLEEETRAAPVKFSFFGKKTAI